MLVFGIDVPLVEVLFTLVIIIFLLLLEAVIIQALLMKQINRTKQLAESMEKVAQLLAQLKQGEWKKLEKR